MSEKRSVGRPKLPPEEGKRYPLGLRTTAEMRRKLGDAAAASGRSLAQEVEHRLERSFDREALLDDLRQMLNERQLYALNGASVQTDKYNGGHPA